MASNSCFVALNEDEEQDKEDFVNKVNEGINDSFIEAECFENRRKRKGPNINFPEIREKYSKGGRREKQSSNFNTQRSRNSVLNTKAFKNEVVYSTHVKDYGLIGKTFLDSKLGKLFGMSWTTYIDEINQKGIRDPTSSQLKTILSDLQTDVCKKLSVLSHKANSKNSPASNTTENVSKPVSPTATVRKPIIRKTNIQKTKTNGARANNAVHNPPRASSSSNSSMSNIQQKTTGNNAITNSTVHNTPSASLSSTFAVSNSSVSNMQKTTTIGARSNSAVHNTPSASISSTLAVSKSSVSMQKTTTIGALSNSAVHNTPRASVSSTLAVSNSSVSNIPKGASSNSAVHNIVISNPLEHQLPVDARKQTKQPECGNRPVTIKLHGKFLTLAPTSVTDKEIIVEHEGSIGYGK